MKRIYTFNDAELQELVNDNTSKVFIKKSVLHISLHAYHFADLKQSLCEIFDDSINRFKSELGGIVLSYRNIKVLSNIGTIINDDSRIYIDVQADFYVFSPQVGSALTGIVNKKSSDHVGCLVHKLFNVSIPRPPEEDVWNGETVEIGQKVSFVVDFMDFDLNLPYIRGKLVDSSLDPELTEEPVKKKKKKRSKDKFKDEDKSLENQLVEAQANQGDEQKQCAEEQQNIKRKKKKDKKDKKHVGNLNQDKALLMFNAQDIGESEHLCEPLEDRLACKSSEEALRESTDWNFSKDFLDISVLACSTQKEEVSPKKKKKKKSKDLDNVNVEDASNTADNSEILQELMNSSHKQEHLDAGKNKGKLFTNSEDVLIENSEDVSQELAAKKKPKKHKKHKQHNADAESGEKPLQNNKPEKCEMIIKSPTDTLSQIQQSKTSVGPGKTKKLGSSYVCGRNISVTGNISNEDDCKEPVISKEKDNDSNAILQSPMAKVGKNLNTALNSSTDSSKPEKNDKRKLSEAELDEIPSPKKKKSIRFSTEVEMIHVKDNVQADSAHIGAELNEERISNINELESDADEPSSISGASIISPFSSSIYSGATMVNSIDRKRKKKVKANEDVATLKQPISNISPSLVSSTRALFQNFFEPNIKDPSVLGLSSPSNSEEKKEQSFQDIHSPRGKSGSEQDSLGSPPSKPLTQRESVSHHSRTAAGETLNALDANVSEGFNSTINAFEPLDISHLIARLNSSENADAQKQEQASKSPKADKKNKRKKKEERVSTDAQAPDHTTTDTGEKQNENACVDMKSKINTTEYSSISELMARLNSENTVAQKQEQSPKSPKGDKVKKSKTKKKEVKEVSTKHKHKEDKKHKKKKDKKEKDKKKKEPKTSKEKKKTKKENDLTDLSRKLLQDFLKKQNNI